MPQASGERPDGADRAADRGRQPPDVTAIHPAQCPNPHRADASEQAPPEWAQSPGAGVAQGGKRRREEGQRGAGASRPPQIRKPVRRTGDQRAAPTMRTRPATVSQMHAGAECGRQPGIAGDHQCQAAGAAEASQVAAEYPSAGFAIMPQDDPRQTTRQARHRGARVGDAARIGEQPEER